MTEIQKMYFIYRELVLVPPKYPNKSWYMYHQNKLYLAESGSFDITCRKWKIRTEKDIGHPAPPPCDPVQLFAHELGGQWSNNSAHGQPTQYPRQRMRSY